MFGELVRALVHLLTVACCLLSPLDAYVGLILEKENKIFIRQQFHDEKLNYKFKIS